MDLKHLELTRTALKANVSERLIEGYASTPDIDQVGDIVEPGACKFSDPAAVQVFVGHKWRLGDLPVGIPLAIEHTTAGLFTRTKIFETDAGDELLAVASEQQKAGRPLGISIGFDSASVKATYERKDGALVRRIASLELREYSFTPMPANTRALVTAVKAIGPVTDDELERMNVDVLELDLFLMRAGLA